MPSADISAHTVPRQQGDPFRLLVESVQDYAIFMLDPSGRVLTWNAGAERIKGYRPEEIIGRHFSDFYPQEARDSGWPQRELELATAEGRFTDEGWRVKKDGSMFWASVVITALRTEKGDLYGFAKVTHDLTERREREERIQHLNSELRERVAQVSESQKVIEARTFELQHLSSRLLQMQDEERRHIARELHDALGQELAGLKMALETCHGDPAKMVSSVPYAIELADRAIRSVRSLSYLLHPPLLDEIGLMAALHWFVEGLQERSGIRIQLTVQPSAFPRLEKDVETTIFRIVQEGLNNVYRHSGSGDARVELDQQPQQVILRIRDYGRGFFPPGGNKNNGTPRFGVGLRGMRERLTQFGGKLQVSAAEPGTLVEALIPLYAVI